MRNETHEQTIARLIGEREEAVERSVRWMQALDERTVALRLAESQCHDYQNRLAAVDKSWTQVATERDRAQQAAIAVDAHLGGMDEYESVPALLAKLRKECSGLVVSRGWRGRAYGLLKLIELQVRAALTETAPFAQPCKQVSVCCERPMITIEECPVHGGGQGVQCATHHGPWGECPKGEG